jgi:hypothetical protein
MLDDGTVAGPKKGSIGELRFPTREIPDAPVITRKASKEEIDKLLGKRGVIADSHLEDKEYVAINPRYSANY